MQLENIGAYSRKMLDKILTPLEDHGPVTPISCGTGGLGASMSRVVAATPVKPETERKAEAKIDRRIHAIAKKRGI
jgi:hypothetical protein